MYDYLPDTVTDRITINTSGTTEGWIETDAEYDALTGAMIRAHINGRWIAAAAVATFVGIEEWAEIGTLDPLHLSDLVWSDADAARANHMQERM